MSNTHIGKNTYLDNQIHIAHNVKIGENSIIAGQVGIAGSSVIGSNVRIGGQAGISGHLKIGNNVEIAGGSGVIKDIPDNSKVMGYPAKNIRDEAIEFSNLYLRGKDRYNSIAGDIIKKANELGVDANNIPSLNELNKAWDEAANAYRPLNIVLNEINKEIKAV